MDLRTNLQKINRTENTKDIQSFRYKDFNYWPIIRAGIYFRSLNRLSLIENQSRVKTNCGTLTKYITGFRVFLDIRFQPIKQQNFAFFFESDQGHPIGKNIYKHEYVDNFAERFKGSDINYFYLKSQAWFKGKFKNERFWINLSSSYWLDRLIIKIRYKFFKKIRINHAVHDSEKIYNIDRLAQYYERILEKARPEYVLLICFYTTNGFALSLACHRLGIKAIDYQHGAQNNWHNMYTSWLNSPQNGYEVIPDYFWTWGDVSKRRIDKWTNQTKKHSAFIGGNSGLVNVESRNIPNDEHLINSKFNRKIILISLQNEQFVSEWFIDWLSINSNNYSFLIRPHPRNSLTRRLIKKYESLSALSLDTVSRANKYNLMKICHLHVTGFSSVAFEALLFGKKTIFIHENAKRGYSDLIDRKTLFFADNQKSFELALQKALFEPFEDTIKYFSSFDEISFSNLEELRHVL